MPRSKTLKLFLMDGEPSGRIKCSLANWTGIAYKIPRTALDKCKDLDILKQSGVYFLFGTDKSDNAVVYIGQAGVRKNGKGLLLRVQEIHNSIDYWTEAVMFTTTNNSFGPTEISYLENRFCNMAIEAGRYVVKNGNDPNPGNITEETESELEEFIDYAKIVMGTLGHKVFEPFAPSAESADTEPVLYMEYGKGKASGKRTSDGFVVLKGSTINPTMTKSCPERTIKDRKKYEDKIDSNGILTAVGARPADARRAEIHSQGQLHCHENRHPSHADPASALLKLGHYLRGAVCGAGESQPSGGLCQPGGSGAESPAAQ